jgi:plastocyanin
MAAALATGASGCSSSPSGSASGSGSATISMANLEFSPTTLTVSPGQTVTVVNDDSVNHDLVENNGDFDTGLITPGNSKTLTAPANPGQYPYTCTLHPFMKGTLVVR